MSTESRPVFAEPGEAASGSENSLGEALPLVLLLVGGVPLVTALALELLARFSYVRL